MAHTSCLAGLQRCVPPLRHDDDFVYREPPAVQISVCVYADLKITLAFTLHHA